MRPEDKPQFAAALADVLAGYGKPLPEKGEINTWFNQLAPFPASTIKKAFEAYQLERPDFAPAPNGIAARCRLLDGRPDENEAWALAMTSRDEADTVVWTEEMATAFDLARPLLAIGDEIGARMAFKDGYKRMVQGARTLNRSATWIVSAGWDAARNHLAVERAVRAGLLAAPEPGQHLALANESDQPAAKPAGLLKLKEALAQLEDPTVKAERLSAQRAAEVAASDLLRRKEIDCQAREYLRQHPEARYGRLVQEPRGDSPEILGQQRALG
jgi:hypothetical protein